MAVKFEVHEQDLIWFCDFITDGRMCFPEQCEKFEFLKKWYIDIKRAVVIEKKSIFDMPSIALRFLRPEFDHKKLDRDTYRRYISRLTLYESSRDRSIFYRENDPSRLPLPNPSPFLSLSEKVHFSEEITLLGDQAEDITGGSYVLLPVKETPKKKVRSK